MSDQQQKSINRRDFMKSAVTLAGFGALSCLPFGGQLLLPRKADAATVQNEARPGIIFGPTPIVHGKAVHEQDFTIFNSRIAASFAAGSYKYWNMTTGSILDLALIHDDTFGSALVDDVEFLEDVWSAIGSHDSEDLPVPDGNVSWKPDGNTIVVTTQRPYWTWTYGLKQPFAVTIEYTLEADADYLGVRTTVTNPFDNEPYADLFNSAQACSCGATGSQGRIVLTHRRDYTVSVRMDGVNSAMKPGACRSLSFLPDIQPGHFHSFRGEILVVANDSHARLLHA